MEKSIKRVERLVHATNSALAQMKLSLMFDDMNTDKTENVRKGRGFQPAFGEKFPEEEDLKQCQKEFNSEATEMLAKIEKLFGSNEINRKNSQALDRIKEINRKMKTPSVELSEPGETHQSRQKLLSLIGEEKFSPGPASNKGSVGSKGAALAEPGKKSSEKARGAPKKPEFAKTPIKSKEELKSKILETQEIVDRGFQTARQLAHKVESFTKGEKKTPEKTASEINLGSVEGKTESNEIGRRERHSEKKKKRDREVERPVNAQVIDFKRKERQKRSNLQVQRLPSVHIRGELQLQKIHSLEISTAGDFNREKSNTGIAFISHEQMEKEKMDAVLEKVRKENCFCISKDSGSDPVRNYIKCDHCGKLIRVQQTRVDPRKVDEILQMCNFNVFDPRIEEFVERQAAIDPLDSVRISSPPSPELREKVSERVKMENTQPRQTRTERRFTLQDLSDQLYNKYREETDNLEGNHLKLDSILQNLFRKVDQSREVFENCHLMKIQKVDSGRVANLTSTKPVLVSFPGEPFRSMRKRRKWEEVKSGCKGRSESSEIRVVERCEMSKSPEREKIEGRTRWTGSTEKETKKEERLPSIGLSISQSDKKQQEDRGRAATCRSRSKSRMISRKQNTDLMSRKIAKPQDCIFWKGNTRIGSPETAAEKRRITESPGRRKQELEEIEGMSAAPVPIGKTEEVVALSNCVEETLDEAERKTLFTSREEMSHPSEGRAPSETSSVRSENNYESDFESMTNEPEEHGEDEPEIVPLVHKLSTISEVDSELERKLGDEPKASKGRDKQEGGSTVSEVSTRKDVALPKTAETPLKSTPTELVTSLKDILSMLQDQFARTESLAEKLTENQKIEGNPEPGTGFEGGKLSHWEMPVDTSLVEALQSARKGPAKPSMGVATPEKARKKVVESFSDEGGSSLGEIIMSERRKDSGKSDSSSISENSFLKHVSGRRSSRASSVRRETSNTFAFKLGVNSEDVSYSEGEIPSENPLDLFNTHSVGEVSH